MGLGDPDDGGDDDVAKNNDDNLGQGEAVMATREWFGELVSKETTPSSASASK